MRATINAAIITTIAAPDPHPDCRALLFQIVALHLKVSPKTFRRLKREEAEVQEAWERGIAALSDEVTHLLLAQARKGNLTAMIFLAKARLGWVEGQPTPGMKPEVQVNIQIPQPMSDEQFQKIIEGNCSTDTKAPALGQPRSLR